jgi:peptidoglycan/LPS O-acetylase OafA/YrhL
MANSEFFKKRSNRIALYIFILIPILLFILIVTLIVPIPDDPPIYHFPFMVYLPISVSFNFLSLLIACNLLRKNEGNFKQKSDNWGIFTKLLQKIEWEQNLTGWRKIFQRLSLIALISAIGGFFLIGIAAPSYLFSPLNMLLLPFIFGMLAIWISAGVRKVNILVAVVLLILIACFILLTVGALLLAQDIRIIMFAVSYQILAFILVAIRVISYYSKKGKLE